MDGPAHASSRDPAPSGPPQQPRRASRSSRLRAFARALFSLLFPLLLPLAGSGADLRVVGLTLAPAGSGFVRLELAATSPVAGVQLDLVYPAAQASLGQPDRGGALGNHVLKSAEVSPGRRRFLVYSASNQPLGNGVLALIPVTHVGQQGTFALSLTNAIVATPAGQADLPLQLLASELVVGSAPPPLLSGIAIAVDGRVRFDLHGSAGRTYRIQGSADLQTWVEIQRGTVRGSVLEITDLPPADLRHRFYRAVLVP